MMIHTYVPFKHDIHHKKATQKKECIDGKSSNRKGIEYMVSWLVATMMLRASNTKMKREDCVKRSSMHCISLVFNIR